MFVHLRNHMPFAPCRILAREEIHKPGNADSDHEKQKESDGCVFDALSAGTLGSDARESNRDEESEEGH